MSDTITMSVNGSFIEVVNLNDTLAPNSVCTKINNAVRCPRSGVTKALIRTRGGRDVVRNDTGLSALPVTVFLDDGNDDYFGGPNQDIVAGGPGTDTMRTFGGNDVISGELGFDTADAGTGADSCIAEVEISCETD
ncbi:hypothetical protein [Planobispora takensis]|uniref:hypothetical protein n=1 Tax=Planobispora takensis TaxID=1367882 RepID=UPI0035EA1114